MAEEEEKKREQSPPVGQQSETGSKGGCVIDFAEIPESVVYEVTRNLLDGWGVDRVARNHGLDETSVAMCWSYSVDYLVQHFQLASKAEITNPDEFIGDHMPQVLSVLLDWKSRAKQAEQLAASRKVAEELGAGPETSYPDERSDLSEKKEGTAPETDQD